MPITQDTAKFFLDQPDSVKQQISNVFGGSKAAKLLQGEPVILSSASAKDRFDKDIQPRIDRANKNLLTAQQFRDRKEEPEEVSVEQELLREGETETEKLNRQLLESYDRQQKQAERFYNELTLAQERTARAQIQNLTGQWNERKRILEQSNKANLATWQQQFIRTGQAEFSPGMTQDFVTAKEREGQRKVQELDNQYNNAIGAINTALDEKRVSAAANLANQLADIEEKAVSLMRKNAEEADKVNKAYRDRVELISKQSAIVGLYEQGITDPAEMLDFLNFNEKGEFVGDISLGDIKDTLDVIQKTSNLTGVSSDLKTFATLYPELKVGTEEFRKKYDQFVVTQASLKRKPEGVDRTELSTASRSKLLGAGFTDSEVDQIEMDISQYGIDTVLGGLSSEEEKLAVQDAYGVEREEEQFLDRSYFEELYSTEQLEKAAVDAGFGDLGEGLFNLKDVDTSAFLDALEKSVDAYRKAGFTDKEILNKMQ